MPNGSYRPESVCAVSPGPELVERLTQALRLVLDTADPDGPIARIATFVDEVTAMPPISAAVQLLETTGRPIVKVEPISPSLL